LQGDFIWRYGDFVRDMKILFRDIEISNTTEKKAQILFKKTIIFIEKFKRIFNTSESMFFEDYLILGNTLWDVLNFFSFY
jgi:hypothetical protein